MSRTFKAFLPGLAKPDDTFAAQYLTKLEFGLYSAMDVRERDHACQVAKAVLSAMPNASSHLIRAALLHDIGKSGAHYNGLERILVHLYTPKNLPAAPALPGLRGAWQRNLHHASLGGARIRQVGGCEQVARIVELHHIPAGHLEAEQLKRIEELF